MALLFNLDWEWKPKPQSSIQFSGPDIGLFLCIALSLLWLHRAFRDFQGVLMARGILTEPIQTPLDRLPILILVPLMLGGSWRGHTWTLEWGRHDLKLWYFLAILVAIFSFQVLMLVRRVLAGTAKLHQA